MGTDALVRVRGCESPFLRRLDDEHVKCRGAEPYRPGPPPANAVIDRATHAETDVWIVLAAGELDLSPRPLTALGSSGRSASCGGCRRSSAPRASRPPPVL